VLNKWHHRGFNTWELNANDEVVPGDDSTYLTPFEAVAVMHAYEAIPTMRIYEEHQRFLNNKEPEH
jgi:hypothetical protein